MDYDVIIIGAGPAGASSAIFLDRNLRVLIVDRNVIPRKKPCGGILIEESVDFLKSLNPPEIIFCKPKKLDLIYDDWDNNRRFIQTREFQNINRKEFDYWLIKKATELKNVHILTESNVEEINREGNHFKLKIKQKDSTIYKTSYIVIDASGPWKISGKTGTDIYTAIQFLVPNANGGGTFDYILSKKITDYYAWSIPKDNNLLIGAALRPSNLKEKMACFILLMKEKRGIKIDPSSLESAPVSRPMEIKSISLSKNGILRVGEAANLISPTTAEGISYALISGRECAKAINNSTDLDDIQKNYRSAISPLIEDINNKIKLCRTLVKSESRTNLFKNKEKFKEIVK